jgi:hypothetical protein
VKVSLLDTVDRAEKRIHVAFPVRVTHFDDQGKPRFEMACTYDISAHGARVTGLRSVKEAGEIVVIERGRSKAYCRIVWIGTPGSPLSRQVGIQCVEAQRTLWETELKDLQEVFDPIPRETLLYRAPAGRGLDRSRRKALRFGAEGSAQLLKADAGDALEAAIKNISEVGCLVTSPIALTPGTQLKLLLRLGNCDLSFKGRVRHAGFEAGLGIEFEEIRKGDRAVFYHLLQKLAENEAAPALQKAVGAATQK